MSDENEDLLAGYHEESSEHLVALEEKLLALEKGEGSGDDINTAFRAIHTVKGGSGFFGLKTIGNMAHVMEDLLGQYRSQSLEVTPEGCNALLEGYEKLLECFENLGESEGVDISGPYEAIKNILGQGNGVVATSGSAESDAGVDSSSGVQHPFSEIPETVLPGFWVQFNINEDQKVEEIVANLNDIGEVLNTYPIKVEEAKDTLDVIFTTVLELSLLEDLLENVQQIHPLEDCAPPSHSEKAPAIAKQDQEPKAEVSKPVAKTNEEKKDEPKTAKKKTKQNVSIRVDFDVLSKLINLSGELILSRNQFINNLSGPMLDEFQAMSKQISELQEGLMKTRMQPLSVVTTGFPRLVRNLAKQLSKKVELIIMGEDIELDRNILEGISAPFTHILRNSLDHGIENPQEREAAGKTSTGKLVVNAYQRGGFVTIEVKDDGKGIDPDKIKSIAIKKGVITEQEAGMLSNKQAIALIYAPGFSTAEQVTEVSGRGVGMDVVKTDFEKLGGTVDLDSEFGKGTTLTVQLPLSVAIIQSIIVRAETELYAVPRNNIREVVILDSLQEKKALEQLQGTDVLRHRDGLLPIVRMSDILGVQRTYDEDQIDRRDNVADRRAPDRREIDLERRADQPVVILVMTHGEDEYGLVVDEVSHQEETVVKNLNQTLSELEHYMGVTILSSGKVCFILDNQGFIKLADIKFQQHGFVSKKKEQIDSGNDPNNQEDYLIFEFGNEERLALLAGLVQKTGVATIDQVMRNKDDLYITHGGVDYSLIFVDKVLQLSAFNIDHEFYFIIPKYSSVPFAFVASKVCGIFTVRNDLDVIGLPENGKIGTVVYQEKLLTVLDLYAVEEHFFKDVLQRKTLKTKISKKVLVVEDAFVFRQILKGYLEEMGIESDMAKHGKEALEFLESHDYDIVISDIEMPEMNGYELVAAIRDQDRFKGLPVVALTSLVSAESREKGLQAGFDDYLVKTDKHHFVEAIQRVIHDLDVKDDQPILQEV